MTEPVFRTFCHISEYNELGYANLHRLVAGSKPLVLWAPSSAMLRAHSSIPVDEFLVLLREGLVRVAGRERWLLDRRYRDLRAQRWAAAAWDDEIDGAIYRTYIEDLHVTDPGARRVIVADDEPGQSWAERTLASDPGQVDFWREVLDRPDVAEYVPGGTLEAIEREGMDPEAATLRILRDARNHGQAVRDTGAEVPFLLSRADTRFLEILSATRFAGAQRQDVAGLLRAASTDALAAQLLEVLRRLDESRDDHSVLPFIRRKGHDELIDWLVTFKTMVEGGSTIDQHALLRDLALRVRQSRRTGFSKSFDGSIAAAMTMIGAVGVTGSAVQLAQEQSLLNILGVAVEGALALTNSVRALGMVEGSYDGVQWPYLFTHGRQATRKTRAMLLDHLAAR